MSLADLKRSWLLKQLGLSSSTLTELDLLNQLYSNQQTSEMEGNGFPEGVVTAPVGSTYIDRQGTNGAIQWIKKSGTGNTGWVVSQGDTGLRGINTTDPTLTGFLYLRRVGSTVTLHSGNLAATATVPPNPVGVFLVPDGFKRYGGVGNIHSMFGNGAVPNLQMTIESSIYLWGANANASLRVLVTSWPTSDAWPSVLPGFSA